MGIDVKAAAINAVIFKSHYSPGAELQVLNQIKLKARIHGEETSWFSFNSRIFPIDQVVSGRDPYTGFLTHRIGRNKIQVHFTITGIKFICQVIECTSQLVGEIGILSIGQFRAYFEMVIRLLDILCTYIEASRISIEMSRSVFEPC